MKLLFVPAILTLVSFHVALGQRDATPAVAPAPPNPASANAQNGTAQTQNSAQAQAQQGGGVSSAEPSPLNLNKPIALRIVGSNVKNLKGEYLGRMEEVALNPESKQIEFALLNINYPTNSTRVTPVPWQLLNYVWDQGQVGGTPGAVQIFRLDVDKSRLALAPSIERNHLADLMQPPFREQLLAFYGGTPEYGASGAATASTSGSAAGGPALPSGTASTSAGVSGSGGVSPSEAAFIGGQPGGVFVVGDTNANFGSSNNMTLLVTNVFPGTTNTFISTNFFVFGTNVFPGASNAFVSTNVGQGGSNAFAGSTNTFQSTNAFQPRNIAANGSSNAFRSDIPLGVPQQGTAAPPVLAPTGRGSGTTAPATPRRGGGGSPWSPPTDIIIPNPPPTANPPLPPGATAPNNDTGNSIPSPAPTPAPVPSPAIPPTPTLPPAPSPQPSTVAPRTR